MNCFFTSIVNTGVNKDDRNAFSADFFQSLFPWDSPSQTTIVDCVISKRQIVGEQSLSTALKTQ